MKNFKFLIEQADNLVQALEGISKQLKDGGYMAGGWSLKTLYAVPEFVASRVGLQTQPKAVVNVVVYLENMSDFTNDHLNRRVEACGQELAQLRELAEKQLETAKYLQPLTEAIGKLAGNMRDFSENIYELQRRVK